METTFQSNKLSDFHCILKIESCQKIKTTVITFRKLVNLWLHSSVATLEAYKSETGVDTNCYKYKWNTKGVILEWILTTRTAATTPRISIFTLSLLRIRAVFLMFANVCLLISQRCKKISTNGFHHCKLHLQKSSSLEYERNRTKLRYWKIVGNEKCTPEIAILSSVKKLFWANHASEKTHISLKREIFKWTNVPEEMS